MMTIYYYLLFILLLFIEEIKILSYRNIEVFLYTTKYE